MNELSTESPYELDKDITFIKDIDQGAFGKVIHVYDTKKKLDLAIKVINKEGVGPNLINHMKEEISILKKLNHKNIVKFYGYSETNNQLLINMEYIKYGTLSKWLKNMKKIREEDASKILSAVLSAVEYMHSQKICHRDIKPDNIMFSEENDLSSIKIIDFGLSAQHLNYLSNNDYCGTFIYMAPEQIEKKLYHYSVDIWSIGILMYMLLNNGRHPFYQKNEKEEDFIKKIKIGKLNFINKLSYMAKHLNHKLCEANPSWRYSANLAMKHPWITRNPNDEIPLTFNEILNKNNNIKNGRYLVMIFIFLNHCIKNEEKLINQKEEKEKDDYYYLYITKKITKNKIYHITKKYINKCNIISEKKRQKFLKRKENYLEVVSTEEEDEEDSIKEKKTISMNKAKKNSPRKINIKYSIDITPSKKMNPFFEKNNLYLFSSPNNKSNNIKNKRYNDTNLITKNNNICKNQNAINYKFDKMKSKSISKFILKKKENHREEIQIGKPHEIKSSKLITKLPFVNNSSVKNYVNTTNKKTNNKLFIKKFNIVPRTLPFIKRKSAEIGNIYA